MLKKSLVFLSIVISVFLHGQNSNLDSLKNALKSAPHDSVRTKILCRIATEEGVSRMTFWDSILSSSKKWNLNSTEALARINIGYIHFSNSKLDLAEKEWKQALHIAEKYKDYEMGPAAANNLAYIAEQRGAVTEAIDLYYKSLEYLEKSKDDSGRGSIYNNLASIYYDLGDVEKTFDCCQKAISIRIKLNDSTQLASSLNNMGYYLLQEKQHAAALAYFERALMIINMNKLKGLLPNTLFNIGTIMAAKGNHEAAIVKFNECLSLYREHKNLVGQSNCLSSIAESELKLGRVESAVRKGEEALVFGKEIGYVAPLKNAYKVLYEGYKVKGNQTKALEMYEHFIVLKDSLVKEENHKASIQRQMKFSFDNKVIADSIKNTEKIKHEQQKHELEIKQQKFYTYGGVIGFLLMLLISGISFNAYRQKQKANFIIEEQKSIVEEKQKEIVASINYAQRIQYALLAQDEVLKKNLKDHFVMFKPKDIVSGDFYWATNKEDRFYLAICDSTGHGVPGAFMSLLNISYLNEAITEKNIRQPDEIFDHVRKRLIENVSQDGAQDGMDGILICFHNGKITYAAAHNPPVVVSNGTLTELPYDKMPVGKGERMDKFTLHEMDHQKGDLLYFYTDGYADQFGGKNGKKFKYKQLNELLIANSEKTLSQQKEIFATTIEQWRGRLEQVDDILLIGIRV